MDIKPWEPTEVIWQTGNPGSIYALPVDTGSIDTEIAHLMGDWFATFKLANNQRIIVRALSEDRKAARAAMKEASQ